MNENKRKSSFLEKMKTFFANVRIGIIVFIIFLVFYGIYSLFSGLFGSGNYPLRYHRQLDDLLGRGRWECVEKKSEANSLLGEDSTDDGQSYTRSYKRWLIEYTEEQGDTKAFWISNFSNRKKSSKLSNKVTFGMEISDYLCVLAEDMIEEDIIEPNFEAMEVTKDDVRINMQVTTGGLMTKVYYKNLVKNIADYNVDSFTPENLLKNKDEKFMVEIQLYSFRQNSESIANIDKKVENIANQLLESYGEHATYFIEITHYSSEEYSSEKEDIINHYYKIAYDGKEVSKKEIEEVVGECRDYLDFGTYIEKIK